MGREMQDVVIVDYDGPQGSFEVTNVESATISRSKTRNRAKVMNRTRTAIGFQSGTEEVSVTLSVVPETITTNVNWHKAWKDNEEFGLVVEKGLDGTREQLIDCTVASVNDSANEDGESRLEVTIEALQAVEEP